VSDQNTIVSILDQGTVLRGGKVDKESKKVTSGEEPNVLEGKPVSRRDFLKIAGVAGAAIGLGAGLGGLIAACGGNGAITTTAAGATTTTAAAAKNLVLGYSAPFLFSDYETAQQNATFAVAEASGWKTLPATNADGDSAKQNSDVRNLISAGATGLIVVANDSKAIIPSLDYAKEKAVPVVAIDIGPDGGSVAMIVRANNVGMGGIAADAMAKSIGEKGTVLSLMGAQTSINGRDRSDGFRQGIAKYPNIKLIEFPTDWDATNDVDRASGPRRRLPAGRLRACRDERRHRLQGLRGKGGRAWSHLQHQHRCYRGGARPSARRHHGCRNLAAA
jgi:hypothetical protein